MINFLFLWFKKPKPVSLCILKTGPGVKPPSLSVHSSKLNLSLVFACAPFMIWISAPGPRGSGPPAL